MTAKSLAEHREEKLLERLNRAEEQMLAICAQLLTLADSPELRESYRALGGKLPEPLRVVKDADDG